MLKDETKAYITIISMFGIIIMLFAFAVTNYSYDSEWNIPEWKCITWENATATPSDEFNMCFDWCTKTINQSERDCYSACNLQYPVGINGTCVEQYYSRSLRR